MMAEWLTVSGFSSPTTSASTGRRRCGARRGRRRRGAGADLIVGGDLDPLTPLLDAPVFGPRLGSDVRIVTLAQHGPRHLAGGAFLAEGMRCARWVIRSFVRGALNDSLRSHHPGPARAVYPATLTAAAPATLISGADPGENARRAATVAAQAFADAVFRRYYSGVDAGPGLRGGTFTANDDTSRCAASASSPTRASTARGGGWRLPVPPAPP